jgi:FKBP-type peptidyl-prolyl cis-trans isomerase 2
MKIEARKVVTLAYDLYVDGENGQEELMEKATAEAPLVYCHGEGMMLPAFEQAMAGSARAEHSTSASHAKMRMANTTTRAC